jgi:hypothetical protein
VLAGASATAAPDRAAGCDRPLTYDVVSIDPRFHVSKAAFIAQLERAERLCEVPARRELLQYRPGGDVKVSLVYDGRTVAYLKRARIDKAIAADDARISRLETSIDRTNHGLARRLADLNARETALNRRVTYWNERGGAPAKLYDELGVERESISRLVTSYRDDVGQERQVQSSFNALVDARNILARRGSVKAAIELGRATLGGTEMQIFAQTGNAAKDATLAAHEFGHILGLGHIVGPGNIMNPYLVKALSRASASDLAALARVCDR